MKTEDSCRDVVSKTKKVAEEERKRSGETESDLAVVRAQSRKAL